MQSSFLAYKSFFTDIFFLSAVTLLSSIYLYRRFFKRSDNADLLIDFHTKNTPRNSICNGDFVDLMVKNNRNVAIFYGSQTGTAEIIAKKFEKFLMNFETINPIVLDPENCDFDVLLNIKNIPDSFLVFIMATYGEGEPTDNAKDLVEWLETCSYDLSGIKYMIFGLGNSTYSKFNFTAKKIDKILKRKSAFNMHMLGLGDDDKNLDLDFIRWRDSVHNTLVNCYGFREKENANENLYISAYKYKPVKPSLAFSGEPINIGSFVNQNPPYNSKNPYLAELVTKKELYNGGDRSCLHLEFNIKGSEFKYEAGDHLAILPSNDIDRLALLESLIDHNFDQIVDIEAIDPMNSHHIPFPVPCSYRTAFTYYLDIKACPSAEFFRALLPFTSDSNEKKLLQELSCDTEAGTIKRKEWIKDSDRDLVEILQILSSCKAPIYIFCELLSRLQVRYYSISSTPEFNDYASIHITAAIVSYISSTGRQIKGIATGQFSRMKVGDRIPIYVRTNKFRLPLNPQVPVVMVGPGTGLAPFRGFLQFRSYLSSQGSDIGPCLLFFGCRNEKIDFMYESELKDYEKSGVLSLLSVAFSRDPVSPQDQEFIDPKVGKVYVQNKLKQHGSKIWSLLNNEKGNFYICGDAKNMARDVQSAIAEIAKQYGGLSDEKAICFLDQLEKEGRYFYDVWS